LKKEIKKQKKKSKDLEDFEGKKIKRLRRFQKKIKRLRRFRKKNLIFSSCYSSGYYMNGYETSLWYKTQLRIFD
jgi:Zn-dependent oligopeptidase